MTSRRQKNASIVVVALVIATWLGAVAILERQSKGSESIVITEPPLGQSATLGSDSTVRWTGLNEAEGNCDSAATGGARTPIEKGAFSARTGPYPGYGEGLAWLAVRCDDEWAGHYARKIKRPFTQPRVEIARVGLDTTKMNAWINEVIVPEIEKKVQSLEGQSENVSFRVLLRHYVNVNFIDVDVNNARLTVDEGFAIEGDIKVELRTRESRCRLCLFSIDRIEGKGRLKAKLAVAMAGEKVVVQAIDVVPSLSSYASSTVLPDNWGWIRSWIQKKLRVAADQTKGRVGAALSAKLNDEMESMRDDLGENFAHWMTKQRVIDRITQWTRKGDFTITRGLVHRGGERIEFSVSVSAPWLERPAPALRFNSGEHGSAIAFKISYAVMNKALQVLLDRPFAEVIGEARELRSVINELKDGLTGARRGQRSEGLQWLARHAGELKRILELAGTEFDTSLGFKLPIAVEPEGRNTIRMALIDARVLKGTGQPPQAWLTVSAEAKIGLARKTSASEVGHLRRHIGFEAVADQAADDPRAPRRYRALAVLMTTVVRGEGSRWYEPGRDTQSAVLRQAIDALGATAQIELPIRARIGSVGIIVTQLRNDHKQYAMVMRATMER